jgi:hypothetical protein
VWAVLRGAAIEDEVRELLAESRALYKKKGGVVSCQVRRVQHMHCRCTADDSLGRCMPGVRRKQMRCAADAQEGQQLGARALSTTAAVQIVTLLQIDCHC